MSLIAAKKKLLMAQKGGADISELFNTSLWTGTSAARTISTGINSGAGSLVWIKSRNSSFSNTLFDTTRGATLALLTDSASQATTQSNGLTSFSVSGYDLGNNNTVNGSGNTYVGWQFRRAKKFFDIVQYTGSGVSGRQIAHNLGVKPGMMIVKRLEVASDWQVYHQAQGATKYGVLNSTAAFATASNRWNNTEPTASAFTVGNDATVNANGGTYIAYLFAHDTAIEGLIRCGIVSDTNIDVILGWQPQFLLLRPTAGSDWVMLDTVRGIVNNTGGQDKALMANTSQAETDSDYASINATGFKVSPTMWGSAEVVYVAIREAT